MKSITVPIAHQQQIEESLRPKLQWEECAWGLGKPVEWLALEPSGGQRRKFAIDLGREGFCLWVNDTLLLRRRSLQQCKDEAERLVRT